MTEQNAEPGTQIPFTKVISHLNTFPVFTDTLSALQQHPVGQRSISITSTAYDKFLRPFSPYFVKVNQYASPYVTKADDIADLGLGKVEAKFPILKEPTENVKSKVTEQLQSPKEYVLRVYQDELAKEGSKGYLPVAKAGLTASLVVAAESIQWIVDTLSKKGPASEKANGTTA